MLIAKSSHITAKIKSPHLLWAYFNIFKYILNRYVNESNWPETRI